MNSEEFKKDVFVLKDKLYRFSKRILNDATEAEDITQEVLLKLWDLRKKLNQYNSIEAFAMTTTRNLCLDRIRRKKLSYEKEKEVVQQLYYKDDKIEQKEIKLIIIAAINNLPEPQKTIMHLRDIEDYDYEEIAEVVNMKIETLRVNLSRARSKVREEIKKVMNYGVEHI